MKAAVDDEVGEEVEHAAGSEAVVRRAMAPSSPSSVRLSSHRTKAAHHVPVAAAAQAPRPISSPTPVTAPAGDPRLRRAVGRPVHGRRVERAGAPVEHQAVTGAAATQSDARIFSARDARGRRGCSRNPYASSMMLISDPMASGDSLSG